MSKQAYLISGYCEHTCSECGVKYTEDEYFKYYSLDKIVQYHINCKKCGAEFHEEPKQCYYEEHHPGKWNACGEQLHIGDICYCQRQITARKRELQSWGCYYSCEYYKPPKKEPEYIQLRLWEE